MKNLFVLVFLGFLVLAMNGCSSDDNEDAFSSALWIYMNDEMEQREFDKVLTTQKSSIWVERGLNIQSSILSALGDYFDNTVYPLVTAKFAENYDADGDGRVALVIFKGETTSSYVGGYFYPGDFYDNATSSNKWDAVYLNGQNLNHLPGSQNFNNTAAHEFQHLCNYSKNVMDEQDGDPSYSTFTWIDEGMSENAGAMCAGISSQYSRLYHYASDYDIQNGLRSVTIWEQDLDNYDLVYMFFGYLRGRFGDNIFKSVIEHSSNGFEAIDTAVSVYGGVGFNSIFVDFINDLRVKNNFPSGFFPSGFFVPEANNPSEMSSYAFVYAGAFSAINSNLSYYNSSKELTATASEAVAAVYMDEDESTWSAAGSTDGTESFSLSVNSKISIALKSAVFAEESGKTDLVFMPEEFK